MEVSQNNVKFLRQIFGGPSHPSPTYIRVLGHTFGSISRERLGHPPTPSPLLSILHMDLIWNTWI